MADSILQHQLEKLAADRYPLHMPGHKRHLAPAPGLSCYAWDITEIDGADDLHEADGILADAMARTAALYGARRCWYLVGGSTVGLLAGIRALAPFGSEVIAARNCHKAVYHAIELGRLTAHYLPPPVDTAFGVYGSVPPAAVEAALTAHPQAKCVILTSPTYEGVLSDIASIAAICHAHNVPLLVDEAHGAHYLPFAARYGWQGGAVAAGADLVVQSAHKTLPSLTQTAFLQLNGGLADPDEVERQLDVFETSSPSYPLLVSLDGCTDWLAADGPAAFARWRDRLERFSAAVADLHNIKVMCFGQDALADHPDFFAHDSGKILLQIGAEQGDIPTPDNQGTLWYADGDLVATVTTAEDGQVDEVRFSPTRTLATYDFLKVTHDGTKGEVTITLPLGTYTISEVQAPYGFVHTDHTYTVVLDWDNQYNDLVLAKSIIDHTQDGDVVYDYSIINVGNANAEQIEKQVLVFENARVLPIVEEGKVGVGLYKLDRDTCDLTDEAPYTDGCKTRASLLNGGSNRADIPADANMVAGAVYELYTM